LKVEVAGHVVPLAAKRQFDLGIDLGMPEGLRRIAPYLRAAGIEPELAAGNFTAKITGGFEADAQGVLHADLDLDHLELSNTAAPDRVEALLTLAKLSAHGFRFDPATSRLQLATFELSGLRVAARQDEERALHLLGVKTLEAVGDPAAAPLDLALTDLSLDGERPPIRRAAGGSATAAGEARALGGDCAISSMSSRSQGRSRRSRDRSTWPPTSR
jgi:hypothetical protein